MRIGIDVDDTITNSYDYIIDKVSEYYNMDKELLRNRNLTYDDFFNSEEFPNYSIYAEENYNKYISNVPIKEDAVIYLNKLYDEGNEIYVITARHVGEYNNPYQITQDYLFKHHIPYSKIIVGTFDKGKTCEEENIDLFIDDSVNNCTSAKKHNINVLLFDARFNKNNNDFKRVNNWKEIYDIVHKEN